MHSNVRIETKAPGGRTVRNCSKCRVSLPMSAYDWNEEQGRPHWSCRACRAHRALFDERMRQRAEQEAELPKPAAPEKRRRPKYAGYLKPILKLAAAGASSHDVLAAFPEFHTVDNVRAWCKRRNIKLAPYRHPEADVRLWRHGEVLRLYPRGSSYTQIGVQLRVSRSTVAGIVHTLKKRGLCSPRKVCASLPSRVEAGADL